MQDILHVARNFPIIRFDAAMVLAKKSIRRLWYPRPGSGGDIYSRAESALSDQEFEARIPNEFWREVVDRVAREVPDTLLLAEAFWMMEGYFVRTLGMHRVYNSAFMNMLKKEENQKYRDSVKNTIKFDPQILKRYVNFMNNPDEDTAVAQFGKDDKYFGVCTLMITMPGLPMFGHGQIEGFTEKYGMEFTKAYRNETPDQNLVNRHWHDIFPLMKKRYIFANVDNFLFYDVWDNGGVNENIFAYSNSAGSERAVVFYNNKYDRAQGWIKQSCEYAVKTGEGIEMRSKTLSEGLGLSAEDDKFMIFREQRTGLWYIRRSREICERGMFVALNGFDYQVLMDIHEVADMPDARYRTLCDTLQGRGCYDLEIEWQEICFRDLYQAFSEFAAAFAPSVHKLFNPADGKILSGAEIKAGIKTLLTDSEKAAVRFYLTANGFAGSVCDMPKESEQFKQLAKTFELLGKVRAAKMPKKAADSMSAFKKAKTVEEFLTIAAANDPNLLERLACFAMVKDYAETELAERWALPRKFAEYFQNVGLLTGDLRGDLTKLFTLAKPAQSALTEKDKQKSAFTLVSPLTQGEKAFMLSGANSFNGVTWFNKELTDLSLTYEFSILALLTDSKHEEEVLKLYADVLTAKAKSEYKCEDFVKPFLPAEKTVKKTATKTKKSSAEDGKAVKPAKKSTKKTAK